MDNHQNFDVKTIKVEQGAGFKRPKPKFRPQNKYFYVAAGIILAIVLVVAIAAFLKGWFSFSQERVKLEITAPAEISSGEEISFNIRYQNDNRISLSKAKLIIDYPQGSYSPEGNELTQERLLAVRLNYQPENISSRFENFASFKIKISSVLIDLYLTTPSKAISGEEVSYALDYLNNSDRDFSDLRVELIYPSGFTFKSAEPEPIEENNIWQIEKISKGERGTIKILGTLEGLEGENKILKASLGEVENNKILRYSQTNSITQISSSPLLISLLLNNKTEIINLDAGERLNYKIEFKNNTDIALSQLILKAYFQGEMFNFRTLSLKNKGFFDSLNNVITWSAAGVPSLALLPPGESGEVGFSISINDKFPLDDFSDKNFEVSLRVELETVNVPPQFNLEKLKVGKTLSSKINSKVILQTKAYYNETSANITNFGPIPPKVNKVTTYTIHWQITNSSNDLENVRIKAILPQGIEWRNVYTSLSPGARLEYNERTKQVVWAIDKIPAGTGFLVPAYELIFQIALRPSLIQIGTSPVLIDESQLEARDSFTNEILESFDSAIDTTLPDDPSVGFGKGEVVE